MRPWLSGYLACQDCSGELAVGESLEERGDALLTGTLECPECQLAWPVLAGVPIMVTDPGHYLAGYREAVLATLVEHDMATRTALELVDEFAQGHLVEARRFGDDWTAAEVGDPMEHLEADSKALGLFQQLRACNSEEGLENSLLSMLGSTPLESVIEVGPGAGVLSESLAQRSENLVMIDLSLRSLLVAKARCHTASAAVACIVGDAGELELASDRASVVIAANVVDLMEAPQRFVAGAARWLLRGGELLLSTPLPSLGSDNDDTLHDMLEGLDFRIEERRDGIPWLRDHGARKAQLYWLQAIRASI